MTSVEDRIPIPRYFHGKKIFITGGSGFMGKVLIEKLLRSCPDISVIYVLMRPKKGKNPEERIKMLTDSPLYDILKKEYPENIKKIVPILGNVAEIGLGLSAESRKLLINEVDVIYHAAASVRFDNPLKDAILMNTRGTREVVHLAQEMKHLDVLVHVSTTYCNTDKQVIEEKMYPAHADWREAIKIAENVDPHILNILTPHYMSPMPNTYTFTKSLAEHVINDLCDGQIPSVIFRPSIVISTLKEPVPGWIDNFNGPVGILVASGKGILRSVYTEPNLTADYIPVDIVIKGIIISTWAKAIEKIKEEKLRLLVYNASNNNINNITISQLVEMGLRLTWKYPLNNILWYPSGCVTTCYPNHFLRVIFFHVLPALFIDGLLKVTGHKPMLLRIQRKIYIANMALQYFITQEWKFINDNASNLEYLLVSEDQEDFSYGRRDTDPNEYFENAVIGTRQYLLKEDDSTMAQAKIHSRRYQGGHAASHYRESGHCYALQLGSHRVWDYKGDNFVHRLLQNKADGKLVPSEGPPSESECAQEKVDSVQLEFTYLLTSQLEEQRMYFEDKLALLDSQLSGETQHLRNDITTLSDENKQLRTKLHNITKEKQALEKKSQQQSSKLSSTLHELNEEKQLGKALRNNQQHWQTKLTKLEERVNELQIAKDKEVADLKEQVRDLMFFINATQVIEKSEDKEDIAQGTVTIAEAPQTSKGKKGKKRR